MPAEARAAISQLVDQGLDWLKEAERALYIDESHYHSDIACLDCLLTFDAQALIQGEKLQRRKALEAMRSIL